MHPVDLFRIGGNMKKSNRRKLLRTKLRKESKATWQISLEVLREFECMGPL